MLHAILALYVMSGFVVAADPAASGGCDLDTRGLLQGGERILGSVCRQDVRFVLTDRTLIILPLKGRGASEGGASGPEVTVSLAAVRVDARELLAPGLVAFAASDEAFFLLTKDRLLSRIPVEQRGDAMPAFRFEETENISRAKMIYFRGLLFVAPVSNSFMFMSLAGGKPDTRSNTLPRNFEKPVFRTAGGKLYLEQSPKDKIEFEVRQPGSVRSVRYRLMLELLEPGKE